MYIQPRENLCDAQSGYGPLLRVEIKYAGELFFALKRLLLLLLLLVFIVALCALSVWRDLQFYMTNVQDKQRQQNRSRNYVFTI